MDEDAGGAIICMAPGNGWVEDIDAGLDITFGKLGSQSWILA
jgi:hypothetical protein